MARRGRKPKRRFDLDSYKGTCLSAVSLFLIVFAVISGISVIAGFGGGAGTLNSRLRDVLVDGFGLMALFIPPILFYTGLLLIGTLRWKILSYRVLAGFTLLYISILGAFGGVLGGQYGAYILDFLGGFISRPGAFVFYLASAIFSIVLITNSGINVLVEKLADGIDYLQEKIFGFHKIDVNEDGEVESEDSEEEVKAPRFKTQDVEVLPAGDTSGAEGDADFVSPALAVDEAPKKRSFEIVKPPSAPVEPGSDSDDIVDAEIVGADEVEESTPKLPYSNRVWEYPPLTLLDDIPNQRADAGDVNARADAIEETLKAFGIKADLIDAPVGPAFTRYEIKPTIGTKTNRITGLATDLALRLRSPSGSVRIQAPIPGTDLVGIEVPNNTPSTVTLRSVIQSGELSQAKNKLALGLGHDVSGKVVVQDIAKWPHALIAGSTGSGKSVMLNAIISTLLYRCSPAECRFIMIDPKLVELVQYNGIPHLLTPVVTDVEQQAVSAFAWAVSEMERRYKVFQEAGVRNLEDYNRKSGFQAEPYIVIVVDELADMMMVAASEVEKYIIRLAQKSRATGIHLVLATQRPSVNILTGTIKANIPTRIAFKVTSNTDSRVIIDQAGAETLIGRGDMLFVPPTDSKATRIQGVHVSDDEITRLVDYLKNTGMEPDYKEEIVQQKVGATMGGNNITADGLDSKVVEALEIVISDGKASASYLQRKLGVGYSRAARMIDDMEDAGIIGQARGSKPRDVLVAGIDEAVSRMSGGSSPSGNNDSFESTMDQGDYR